MFYAFPHHVQYFFKYPHLTSEFDLSARRTMHAGARVQILSYVYFPFRIKNYGLLFNGNNNFEIV